MKTVPRTISAIQPVSIQNGINSVASILSELLFWNIGNQSPLSPLPHLSQVMVAMKVNSYLGGNSCRVLEQKERERKEELAEHASI